MFGQNEGAELARPRLRRAAIIVSTLTADQARDICRRLDTPTVNQLVDALKRLDDVTPKERHRTVHRAVKNIQQHNARPQVLARYLSDEVLGHTGSRNDLSGQDRRDAVDRLKRLDQVEPAKLWPVIRKEPAQAIAVIMRHLSAINCAGLLSKMPEAIRANVTTALIDPTSPDPLLLMATARASDTFLQQAIEESEKPENNIELLAGILQQADHETASQVMDHIETEAPEVRKSVESMVFDFHDLLRLPVTCLRTILQHVSTDDLALALKGIESSERKAVFENMSDRAAEVLREEIEWRGAVPLSDARTARLKIVRTARELEKTGEISLDSDDAEQTEYVE